MTADDLERSQRALDGAARGERTGDDPVAELLAALVAEVDEVPTPDPALLAAFAAAVLEGAEAAKARPRHLLPALLLGGSLLLGGVAAAGNGALPDPVQDVVHELADAVGVDIPTGDEPGNRGGNPGGVEGIGSDGTPPGQGGIVPGNGNAGGGSGVGSDGTPPGQDGTVPGGGNEGGNEGGGGVGPDGTPSNDGTPPSNEGGANGSDSRVTPTTPTTRTPPTRPTPPTTERGGRPTTTVVEDEGTEDEEPEG